MKSWLKFIGWLNLIGGIISGIFVWANPTRETKTLDMGFGYGSNRFSSYESTSYHPEIIISLFCAGVIGWLILISLARALELLEQIADQTKPQLEYKLSEEQVEADKEAATIIKALG